MNRIVFLDTGFVISRIVPAAQHHAKAKELDAAVRREGTRLVTTEAVMIEIADGLSKPLYRSRVIAFLETLERSAAAEIVPITRPLYAEAFRLYRERSDKSWGLTDCISFVVMQEKNITEALAHDADFEQAGFTALMR